MKRSNRSLRSHFSDRFYQGMIKPLKNKIVAISAIAALLFFLLGWMPYRPTVPCTVEPAKVNHLIAPYDAVVASADLFAGDKIVAGQPIVKFDTRALELERDSLQATIKSKEVERNVALAAREKSQAMIVNAEVDALLVQLESIERRISQGVLCAEYDGEIIRGDLRHQIGQVVPKGTSLIQVAPTEGMRIELQIPESKATLIAPGYEGYFSSSARPSDRHKFKITKVTPSTTIHAGENVVIAEAEVSGDSEWLRTGMTGYANVRAGWQPVSTIGVLAMSQAQAPLAPKGNENPLSGAIEQLQGTQLSARQDLKVSRHLFRGTPSYIVHDPISFQSHRFSQSDYEILSSLDKNKTLKEVYQSLLSQGKADDEESFFEFVLGLQMRGLLDLPITNGNRLYDRYKQRKEAASKKSLMKLLFIKIPLFNPNEFLERTMYLAKPLFTRVFFYIFCVMMVAAIGLLFARWDEFYLPMADLLATRNLIILVVVMTALKFWHELGHAYACKLQGGAVPDMGGFLMVLHPE